MNNYSLKGYRRTHKFEIVLLNYFNDDVNGDIQHFYFKSKRKALKFASKALKLDYTVLHLNRYSIKTSELIYNL